MTPLRFYDFMRAGHVKRWHIVNTVRDQTIAEHQYLVAIIAMELYTRMIDPVRQENAVEFLHLVMCALFSDAPEVRYGDYPTPAKKHIKELAGPDLFKKLDAELMPTVPYLAAFSKINQALMDFVEMADAIEAAHWIGENKAGIHSGHVAKGASRRMVEKAAELSARTGVDWFEPVNRILIELGMSYISKSMMETPP